MKSARSIEVLCVALAALVLVLSRPLTLALWPVGLLLLIYCAAIVAFHDRRFLPRRPLVKVQLEAWSMLGFITGVLWFTGKTLSPLENLYLLPLILCALTLGRAVTLLHVAVIACCHLALAAATPALDVMSLDYAARAIGQLAPLLLVAYLTTTLSADITEAREHIETLAQNDALTGLFNARMFKQVWAQEHAACARNQGVYALLMIDLDRLQDINDDFGHDGGNSALQLVAECLRRSIRGTDTAGRLGGDEFAVLLPGASSEVAEAVIKRVRHNVYKTTLDLRSRMIRCSVSIGVVNYPKDGAEMQELLSIADRNMYRDKELRRPPTAKAKA
jgi:diguanylate cyclase (GGDEF)-like protein